ncbi:MAG TPA: sortase [Candidatus Saccharimonadales bacterium]|nr:sortase [Candidatus Saccharimonadales bacterium]
MKFTKLTTGIGIFLTLIGVAVITPAIYFNHRGSALPATPTTSAHKILKPQTISGYPVELYIPSLNMKLKVVDGVYNPKDGSWTLSRDKVHFALPSAVPNNELGNTLIYGHYRPEVFARLKNIKSGEKAIVKTDNGYSFTYRFQESEAVNPADTSIFSYDGEPQLTLQTCSGAWLQNRQLYSFDFIKYEKI